MRYPSVTMSELDATMVKWLTGSIDKDGKKKRREEQKAAQMRVEAAQNLDDQTATDLMLQGSQFSLIQGGTITRPYIFRGYFHLLFINLEGITACSKLLNFHET